MKLFDEGHLKRYTLYAIGEIILVVIGILIALQINSYHESNVQDETLRLYLQNFNADLRKDIDRLNTIEITSAFRYHSLQYILEMAGATPYNSEADGMEAPRFVEGSGQFSNIPDWSDGIPTTFDKEFFQLAFLWSHRVPSHEIHSSTLDELRSTGMYSRIESQELKNAIVAYHTNWNTRLYFVMRELVEDWQKSIEADGVITSDISEIKNPILLVKDRPERIAKIKRLIRECQWWATSAVVLRNDAEELITLVDAEVANL